MCPVPPAMAGEEDVTVRECCRHMAYAVPYPVRATAWSQQRSLIMHQVWSALPTGGRDTSTVVVSLRLALLPDATWQGIVAHEMGHCIDFALYGRYVLCAIYCVCHTMTSQGGMGCETGPCSTQTQQCRRRCTALTLDKRMQRPEPTAWLTLCCCSHKDTRCATRRRPRCKRWCRATARRRG